MKIILAIKNSLGKNVAFLTDNLKLFLLAEILEITKQNQIEGVYLVNKSSGSYLRSKKNIPKNLQLDAISISSDNISSFVDLRVSESTPILSVYTTLYNKSLSEGDSPIIKPVENNLYASTAVVKEKLLSVKEVIYESATNFNLNPFWLGAILIDEIARLAPFEEIIDRIGVENFGVNTSVGLAQIKIETANSIIKKKLYNPNPSDPKLPINRLNRETRSYLYKYLIQPKHNIFFEAAILTDLINGWRKFIDLKSHFDILASLYSLSRLPHEEPHPNDRGVQIAREFYNLAKTWLQ
jgi:hypothetical protein